MSKYGEKDLRITCVAQDLIIIVETSFDFCSENHNVLFMNHLNNLYLKYEHTSMDF